MASIVIPPDHVLLSASFLKRIAALLSSLDIPRRSIPDWIADTLYEYGGSVAHASGAVFDRRSVDVDEAFGNEGSFRWISDFVRLKDQSYKQSPQKRILARVRLIVLCLILCGLLESWGQPERANDDSGPVNLGKYRQRAARIQVGAAHVDAMRVLVGLLYGDSADKFWLVAVSQITERCSERGTVFPTDVRDLDFNVLSPRKGSGHEVSNELLRKSFGKVKFAKRGTFTPRKGRTTSRKISKTSSVRPSRHT
jgi:hypothetical protein